MKKAFLVTIGGCNPAKTDCALLENYLIKNNYLLCCQIKNADLIIVYTCGYSKQQENNSLGWIEEVVKKQKKGARLIVTGCLPSINKLRCDRTFQGTTISASSLQDFDKALNPRVKLRDIKYLDLPLARGPNTDVEYSLRIGWGCFGKCTYCAVKHVFGKAKSRPQAQILREFNNAYVNGYRSFDLVAHDVGAYGKDRDSSFIDLLNVLCKKRADCTFGLLNITPRILKNSLTSLEKNIRTGRISVVVLPIQSGSNRILRLMKRMYTVNDIKFCIKRLNEYNPCLIIKTDLIVGFPQETEEDFADTLALLEWLGRYNVSFQVFAYSKRPYTEACKMPGQIDRQTKDKRFRKMSRIIKIFNLLRDKNNLEVLKIS